MTKDFREDPAETLIRLAEAGGPQAAGAARRAAALAETHDAAQAIRALRLAARLEPLDPGPRLALARIAAETGDIDLARAEAEAVLAGSVDQAGRARGAFILAEIARAQGEAAVARAHYDIALKIEDAMLKIDSADPVAARWFARARGRLAELDAAEGKTAKARTGAEGALALLRASARQVGEAPVLAADIADAELRCGGLELDGGGANTARRHCTEAIARYEALILHEPKEPHWRAALADAWALAAEADYLRHAPADARAAMDKALALRVKLAAADPREGWALAATWRLRAALHDALRDPAAAADSLAQARALGEQFCNAEPGAEPQARFLVHTLLDQADQALRAARLDDAHAAAQGARERAAAFADAPGAAPVWRGDLAACWDRIGECARVFGAHEDARAAFDHAVAERRAAHRADPGNADFARQLAATLLKHADAALAAREALAARAAAEESVALRIAFVEAEPGARWPARDLAVALEYLGLAAHAMGDGAAARDAWEDELALADRAFPDAHDSDGLRFRATVEAHLANLGGVDAEQHRVAALARLDILARDGALTDRDAALRKKLWRAR